MKQFLLALFVYEEVIYSNKEITGIKFTRHQPVFGYVTEVINLIWG